MYKYRLHLLAEFQKKKSEFGRVGCPTCVLTWPSCVLTCSKKLFVHFWNSKIKKSTSKSCLGSCLEFQKLNFAATPKIFGSYFPKRNFAVEFGIPTVFFFWNSKKSNLEVHHYLGFQKTESKIQLTGLM